MYGIFVEPFAAGAGWVPDLLTGWGLAAGAVAARRSRVGWLLATAALLWFAGWPGLLAYRAPLAFAVLTPPERRRPAAFDIAVALALAITPLGQSLPGALALSAALLAAGARRGEALSGAAVLALTIAGASIVTHGLPGTATIAVTIVYGAGVVVAGAVSALAVTRAEWAPAELADTLAATDTIDAFRDALAEALDDRSLRVTFTAAPSEPASGRELTAIGDVAWIEHRAGALADPALLHAVSRATRLQAANVRLQRDLVEQGEELAASGRRLLVAGDEQRQRLERRVRAGPLGRLEALQERLAALGSPELDRARTDLGTSIEELRTLALGLHPGTDVAAAVSTLAERSPLPAAVVAGPLPELSAAARSALLFSCREALANVAKHAAASAVEIHLASTHGTVTLSVSDDGRGGADPALGTGLTGLRDRLELVGGTLTVEPGPGGGTRLVAEVRTSTETGHVNATMARAAVSRSVGGVP